jgi:hypothetical protein
MGSKSAPKVGYLRREDVSDLIAREGFPEVRKTPCRPRSWPKLQPFIAVFSQECTAQFASFGPKLPNTFLARDPVAAGDVPQGRGQANHGP